MPSSSADEQCRIPVHDIALLGGSELIWVEFEGQPTDYTLTSFHDFDIDPLGPAL